MDQKLDFNVDPYFDDFESTGGAKEENYHRVLFRPGFPVQARELTQLQTTLQNQIERFGDHIFENGAQVIPGDVNIDTEYRFVKLQSTFNTTNVENYRQNFVNKIITGSDTGVKARVIGTLAATSSDPITLYIKYENSGTDGDTKVFKSGETITSLNSDNTVKKNPELSEDQTTELSAALQTSNATGTGSAVKVHAGIYYINGFFVKNDEQVIILDKYTNTPNYRVGFRVVQTTVTPEDDENLKDNASGSSNYAAPGAHRYQIKLTLSKIALDSTDDKDFVELARIVNGLPEQIVKNTDYSVLERTLARRTFDESGNYEVRKFGLDVREHRNEGNNLGVYSPAAGGDESKLAIGIEPGKAYISGYEIETIATKYLDVPKARTFARVVDNPIQTPVGNYLLGQNLKGFANFAVFEQVNLVDDLRGGSGSVVGTARVRGLELHSGDYTNGASTVYKVGLFDIQMNEGKTFELDVKSLVNGSSTFEIDVKSTNVKLTGTASITSGATTLTGVGTLFNSQLKAGDYIYVEDELVQIDSVTDNLNATLSANAGSTVSGGTINRFTAKVNNTAGKTLVFPIKYDRIRKLRGDSAANPDNVKSTAYTVRRILTDEVSGTGTIQITLDGAAETFESKTNLQNYTLVVESTTSGSVSAGDIIPITSDDIVLTGSDRTVTISNLIATYNLVASDSVRLIASVRVSGDDGDEKSKTLNENATKDATTQEAVENSEILLGKADIFRLVSVQMQSGFGAWTGSGAIDITERYDLDNGQRDAFYDIGRVKLRPGQPVPTGSLRITFDYFTHGAGDYFSVDSYTGQIDYEDIPNYVSAGNNGETFELRDCLDFRPRVDDSGAGFSLGTASVTELPKIGENVESDFSFYLPRVDKVYVDEFGVFSVLQGVPSINPQPPKDPESGMVLYQLSIPAYTLSTNEIIVKSFDNRRYTMRDIGKLEKRIESLEYYTTLNMLEKETADLQIKDADGFDRFKNGFIVDPFTGHGVGDVQSKDYRVSVDFRGRVCRPMHFTDSVRLVEGATTIADRSALNYQRTGDLITLPYEHTNFINNPYATDAIDVNPYKIAAYTGEIALFPPTDEWKDTERRPDLVVQDDNNFDAIKFMADELGVTGTRWNEWQDEWSGTPEIIGTGGTFNRNIGGGRVGVYQNITLATQVGQVREGERTQIVANTLNQTLGDRIVNISMIPYIRSRPVTIIARNMKPDTKIQAFFDSENVTDYIRPADVFTITADDRSFFEFNDMPPAGFNESESLERTTPDGDFQPAYAVGDVIKNQTHSAVSVTGIAQPSAPGVVNVTVTSASGVNVGHHIRLTGIVGSTELNYTISKKNDYLVTAVSGNVITIKNLDGSNISAITGYTSGGSLQRLQASAVVVYQSYDNPDDEVTLLPVDISVINIKNGFAVGDVCEGTLLNVNGSLNQCEIAGINGTTTTTDVPTMKQDSDDLFTSDIGNFIGVYTIPNTESVRFRTGERVLRLIDSLTNNIQTGLFSTKAEEIYYAKGIAETREATILSTKTAKFVRDRVEERREVRRVTQSNRFLRSFVPRPPSGGGNSGGGGGGHDPLSQTFVVNTPGGAFVTKVDLFFNTRGTRPMIVEIRNVVDGIPSFKILPMAQTVLRADQLNVSDDGTVATTFTFPSPVYLQQGEEYSLTVKTDEPGARIFFSEVGQLNLADNRVVSVNPLVGTFFLSQNGSVQTPHQLRDMKFNLYRAEFDTTATATVDFLSTQPAKQSLKTNPFEMTNGTGKVRVYQRNHGFTSGDRVEISGVVDGFYGASNLSQGIHADVLNGQHVITSAETDSYIITIDEGDITGTSSALSKGFYGGSGIKASRNVVADVIQPNVSQIKLTDTTITYDMKIIDTSYTYSDFINVIENDNYYFNNRKLVCDNINKDAKSLDTAPLVLRATLTSTNPAVSPVIDTTRVSAFCVANRINNVEADDINDADIDERSVVSSNVNVAFTQSTSKISTADATTKELFKTVDVGKTITVSNSTSNDGSYTVLRVSADGSDITVSGILTDESAGTSLDITIGERFLADTAPQGASNEANYVTRRFRLDDPATAFKIMYDANKPSGTTMEVYYKILKEGEDVPFDTIPFVKAELDIADSPDVNESIFTERTHTIEGLEAFTTIAIKVVFKSVNTTVVPKLKNLRVIALAV